MGVRPLDLANWLIVDEAYDAEMAQKGRLLAERPDEVFAARPSAGPPSHEVLELVTAWLAEHHPEVGDRIPTDAGGGAEVGDPRAVHPLDRAGRLVQEDLCLMLAGGGAYRLEAASLCFPSHWRLVDKLGRSLATIHGPVPHYADELEAKVDRFFDRLRVDRPVWRRNLSIHNHDDLFAPDPHESPESFTGGPGDVTGIWLRSERQTLRRLPRTDAVLFTIKTQQCPITAIGGRPGLAQALAGRLRSEQDESRRTGLAPAFPPWLAVWLEDVGSSAS
jgi:hypothetical protein